ncbi:hypothetical protein [Haloplanus natans]|uniref:hypothetical protein n=1 Tax=Haloplanus natans TaxID=376171 RepID=UPI0012F936C3|nr:hypothetical protein [Haloplanus natans]
MPQIPEEYLRIFDEFDIDEKYQRRIAARSLFDFYGDLLTQAGQEYLEFQSHQIHDASLGRKWNIAKSRLQSVGGVEIDENYSRVLNRLGDVRNDVSHNPHLNPEREILVESREMALEWATWFSQATQEYDRRIGELSAKETLIRIVRDTVNRVSEDLSDVEYDEFVGEQESLNQEAEAIIERLEDAVDSDEGITNELIFILSDSKSLEQKNGT